MTPAVWKWELPERKFANPVHVSDTPGLKASFPHTFAEGEGGEGKTLESGRKYHIVARAFSHRDPEDEDDAVVHEIPIRVHEGKDKFIHTRLASDGRSRHYEVHMGIHWMNISSADINGDGDKDEWECAVYWDHRIDYYNETPGDKAHVYAYVKLYELWGGFEGEISTEFTADHAGDRDEPLLLWNLNVSYKDFASTWVYGRTMRADGAVNEDEERPSAELVPGRRYYLKGETRLVNASLDPLGQNPNINKKHWKDTPAAASYKTETREFQPDEAPGQFWVEGWNDTP